MLSSHISIVVFVFFHLASAFMDEYHHSINVPPTKPTVNTDQYNQTKSSLVEPSRTTQPELSTTSRQPIRRRNKRACKDKGKSDCKFWASQKFCKHPSPEFRKWMETNCRLSCGLCKQKKQKRECVDQRSNCRALGRFCAGKFKRHMFRYCPVTCKLCTPQVQNHQS